MLAGQPGAASGIRTGLKSSTTADSSNSSMAAAAAETCGNNHHHQQQQRHMFDPQHGIDYTTAEQWHALGSAVDEQQLLPQPCHNQQHQHERAYLIEGHHQPASATAQYDRHHAAPGRSYAPPGMHSQQLPMHTAAAAAGEAVGQHERGSSRRSKGAAAAAGGKPRGRSGPKSKFSPFIGVSQYKRTGRWEIPSDTPKGATITLAAYLQAHIWDSSSSTKGSMVASKGGKGKQLHLGSFQTAIQAARAYDRAAILLRGPQAALNFPIEEYNSDPVLQELSQMSRQEMVLALRKTCDMEMEAAALEAFHAKVPAGAVHLLHNMTGLPLASSDDGSVQATAAYDVEGLYTYLPTGAVDTIQYQQQQQHSWQQLQPGGRSGTGYAASPPAVLEFAPHGQFWLQSQHVQHTQHDSMSTVPPAGVPPHAIQSAVLPAQHRQPLPHQPLSHPTAAARLPPTMHVHRSSVSGVGSRRASAPWSDHIQAVHPLPTFDDSHQQQLQLQLQQYPGEGSQGRHVGFRSHGSAPSPGSCSHGGAPACGPAYCSGPLPAPQPDQSYYLKPHQAGLTVEAPSLPIPSPVIIYAYESPTAADLAPHHTTRQGSGQPGLTPKPSQFFQTTRPDNFRLSGAASSPEPPAGSGFRFWRHGMPSQTEDGRNESSTSSSGASGGSSMNTSSGSEQHLQLQAPQSRHQQQYGERQSVTGHGAAAQGWGSSPAYKQQQQQQQLAGSAAAVHQWYGYNNPNQRFNQPTAAAACAGGSPRELANPNRCSASGSCPTTHTAVPHRGLTSPGNASPHSFSFTPCMAPPQQRWVQQAQQAGRGTACFAPYGTNAAAHNVAVLYSDEQHPQQQHQLAYHSWQPSHRINCETAVADMGMLPDVHPLARGRQHTPQPQAAAAAAATEAATAGNPPGKCSYADLVNVNTSAVSVGYTQYHGNLTVQPPCADHTMTKPGETGSLGRQPYQQQQLQQQQQQLPSARLQPASHAAGPGAQNPQQQQQQKGKLAAEDASDGRYLPSYMQPEMRVGSLISNDRNSGSNSAHSATTPPAEPVVLQSPMCAQLAPAACRDSSSKNLMAWQQQPQQQRSMVGDRTAAAAVQPQRAQAGSDEVWLQPQQPQQPSGNMYSLPDGNLHLQAHTKAAAAAAEAMLGHLSDHAVEKSTAAAAAAVGQHMHAKAMNTVEQQHSGVQAGNRSSSFNRPSSIVAADAPPVNADAQAQDFSSAAPIRPLTTVPSMAVQSTSAAAVDLPSSHDIKALNPQRNASLWFRANTSQGSPGLRAETSDGGSDSVLVPLLPPNPKPVRRVLSLAPEGQAGGPEGGTAVLLIRPSATPPIAPGCEPAAALTLAMNLMTAAADQGCVPLHHDTAAAAAAAEEASALQPQQQQLSVKQDAVATVSNSNPAASTALVPMWALSTSMVPALSGPIRSISSPRLVSELAHLASISSGDFAGALNRVNREGSGIKVFREGSGLELGLLLESQQLLYPQHSLPGLDQLDALLLGGRGTAEREGGGRAAAAVTSAAELTGYPVHINSEAVVTLQDDDTGTIDVVKQGASTQGESTFVVSRLPAAAAADGSSAMPAAVAAAGITYDSTTTAVGTQATAAMTAPALDWSTAQATVVEQEASGVSMSKRAFKGSSLAADGSHNIAAPELPLSKKVRPESDVSHAAPAVAAAAADSSDAVGTAGAVGTSHGVQPPTIHAAWLQLMQE